jgi:hypothetical protein
LKKSRSVSKQFGTSAGRRFQLQKRRQHFIRTHNETLSVVAMCVSNEDRSTARNVTADCVMLLLCWSGAASGIVDHLRGRFARFKLGAHLL